MMNYLKQSTVWATKLKSNVFKRARLILTLYYLLIIAVIIGIFSFLLYFALINNIKDNLKDQFYDEIIEQEVFTQTITNVKDNILFSDLVALIALAFFSYLLADRTLRPIKRSLDNQRKFSSDASHELRTPLAIIQSEAEIILRNKNNKTEDYIQTIESSLEEVNKMKNIVENLLVIARSDEDTANDKFSKVNLSILLEKISEKMKKVATSKGITFASSINNDLNVNGNSYFLEHALSNVIQNAIEYTPKGHVSVLTENDANKITIKIIDTGIGINKADLPNILKRFYRANQAKNIKSGAGLGLAITDQIIKNHQGEIHIESEEGKGATFKIHLPKYK